MTTLRPFGHPVEAPEATKASTIPLPLFSGWRDDMTAHCPKNIKAVRGLVMMLHVPEEGCLAASATFSTSPIAKKQRGQGDKRNCKHYHHHHHSKYHHHHQRRHHPQLHRRQHPQLHRQQLNTSSSPPLPPPTTRTTTSSFFSLAVVVVANTVYFFFFRFFCFPSSHLAVRRRPPPLK